MKTLMKILKEVYRNLPQNLVIIILLCVIVMIAMGIFYLCRKITVKPQVITQVEYREVPKIVEKIKVREVPIEKIVVLDKKDVEKKIPELAEAVKKNEEITATGVVPPYKGKTDVASVINMDTGESKIIVKQRPLPFIEFLSEKEMGVRAGLSTDGMTEDIYTRWTFLRVGKVYISLYAEGSTTMNNFRPNGKLMGEISVRW